MASSATVLFIVLPVARMSDPLGRILYQDRALVNDQCLVRIASKDPVEPEKWRADAQQRNTDLRFGKRQGRCKEPERRWEIECHK